MRIVCIGECMLELRAEDEERYRRSFAGDVYNTAVYLKRSLPMAQVQFFTCTGDDAISRAMRGAWRREGIDGSLAVSIPHEFPGLYMIETDTRGERSFLYWRGQSAARRWLSRLRERADEVLRGADLVYFSGISLAILTTEERAAGIELLSHWRRHVGRIVFDPNVRPSLWSAPQAARETIEAVATIADVVLPSAEDAQWLYGTAVPLEQLTAFGRLNVAEVALTLGAAGCLVLEQQVVTRVEAPVAAKVTDTSGAGDAFNGAYLAARLRGGTPIEAARAGLLVASRVVAHPGAIVPVEISHPNGL